MQIQVYPVAIHRSIDINHFLLTLPFSDIKLRDNALKLIVALLVKKITQEIILVIACLIIEILLKIP